jgi:hypothetical protein
VTKRKTIRFIVISLFILGLVVASLLIAAAVSSPNIIYEKPEVEWAKTYGGVEGNSVIQTADGGYAIAGANATFPDDVEYGYLSGNYIALLVKTDSAGEAQWQTIYEVEGGDSVASTVMQTNDSGYAIFGMAINYSTGAFGVKTAA